MMLKLPRSIAAGTLAFAALWLARAGAAPTVTFELDPPNPVAGQTVRLRDTSAGAATSWLWDFGDGSSATTASPSHAWSQPGPYTVRLLAQGSSAEQAILVSAETTLRLLAAHPFEVSIEVKDPGDGSLSPAQAIAISDRFGWFSFPTLTSDPGNPEVTVKVLEAPTFGHYWIFWSAMTSLRYTMTVRDVTTGQVQTYEKTDGSPCGSWDLESFPLVPTPTPGGPTATPAVPTPTPGGATATPGMPTATPAPGQPTRTPTPSPTVTPTATVTPIPGPTQLSLEVYSWGWRWCPVQFPCQAGTCAYEVEPQSTIGDITCNICGITLHAGCSYELTVFNTDSAEYAPYHDLNAHPEIGLPNNIVIPQGTTVGPVTITVPSGGAPYDVNFNCLNTSCGNAAHHESMVGVIHIAP